MEVAATLRLSPLKAFWRVALPLAKPGILTGAVLGFAHTVGEYGVVMMIGGNTPKTRVISTTIVQLNENQQFGEAYALSAIMVVFAFAVIFTVMMLDKKRAVRGVTALFGPSGCGKTSILRAIAGLNRLEGTVRIGAEIWQDKNLFLPPHSRAVGYVFQEPSLFPHLSVRDNLTFGMGKGEVQSEFGFDEVVAILALEALIRRYPHHLSGGERQRVAIGRALLSNPRVLLMDEPLSALDQTMREEIMPFLARLRAHLQIPIFYISHDMREVERLADTLVLIESGRTIASGPLQKLQADPNLPLARNAQAAVSLEATVHNFDAETGLATFMVGDCLLFAPLPQRPDFQHIRLKIAARDVSLTLEKPKPNSSSILNILPAKILSASLLEKHEMLVTLALDEDNVILSRISLFSWDKLQLHQGQEIYAQIKGVSIVPKEI